jgi:hypothetical protein
VLVAEPDALRALRVALPAQASKALEGARRMLP